MLRTTLGVVACLLLVPYAFWLLAVAYQVYRAWFANVLVALDDLFIGEDETEDEYGLQ